MSQSLRFLPAGMFGSVMGLAGLGLACRAAGTVLPVPAPLAEFWIWLALLVLALLLPAYLLKAARYPGAVRDEWSNAALTGFCAALPVGLTLAAAGLEPYSAGTAQLLWWCGAPPLLLLQLWVLSRVLRGQVRLAQVNGGWFIVMVGGIVTPFAGLPLGHAALCTAMFCLSAAAAPLLFAAVAWRLRAGPALAEAFRPSWFILLVPPSLIYVNGAALWPEADGALEILFYAALPLAAWLLLSARRCWRWPFGAPWWAFTFPLDALAGAALHHARTHPGGPWPALAAALLLLATAAVALVLARSALALARGTLLLAPAAK